MFVVLEILGQILHGGVIKSAHCTLDNIIQKILQWDYQRSVMIVAITAMITLRRNLKLIHVCCVCFKKNKILK